MEKTIIMNMRNVILFFLHSNLLNSWKEIKGQLRIYFMDKETLEPFTDIDANYEDVSKYSVQLEFVSSVDQSFSFITSLFSPGWDVTKIFRLKIMR